ncbi:class I SAM-dependent methyltransferase [Candidatus Parcubacteria bacterium]|nr:MAG: class I SAM-dependent methyltransferase [Candidatus Parcubacteria bacterium]
MISFIKKIFYLPEAAEWLMRKDSADNYIIHRRIISKKKLLRKIYSFYFSEVTGHFSYLKEKKIIEIGSGAWSMSLYNPKIISSDLIKNKFVEMSVDAQKMPFKDNDLDGIVMIDVLHHLPDPEKFFLESVRVLKKGGRVAMIEPYLSPLGKLYYNYIHHEECDHKSLSWSLPQASGRLSGSNLATPFNIFIRDRELFRNKFKDLKVLKISLHTCFSYFLSGGLSFRSLVPNFLAGFIMFLERKIFFLYPYLASQMTIVLEKKDN